MAVRPADTNALNLSMFTESWQDRLARFLTNWVSLGAVGAVSGTHIKMWDMRTVIEALVNSTAPEIAAAFVADPTNRVFLDGALFAGGAGLAKLIKSGEFDMKDWLTPVMAGYVGLFSYDGIVKPVIGKFWTHEE